MYWSFLHFQLYNSKVFIFQTFLNCICVGKLVNVPCLINIFPPFSFPRSFCRPRRCISCARTWHMSFALSMSYHLPTFNSFLQDLNRSWATVAPSSLVTCAVNYHLEVCTNDLFKRVITQEFIFSTVDNNLKTPLLNITFPVLWTSPFLVRRRMLLVSRAEEHDSVLLYQLGWLLGCLPPHAFGWLLVMFWHHWFWPFVIDAIIVCRLLAIFTLYALQYAQSARKLCLKLTIVQISQNILLSFVESCSCRLLLLNERG